jgi:hypothetical protein
MRVWWGAVAQLGERLVRNEEVSGSIPLSSTIDFDGTIFSLVIPTKFRRSFHQRPEGTTVIAGVRASASYASISFKQKGVAGRERDGGE